MKFRDQFLYGLFASFFVIVTFLSCAWLFSEDAASSFEPHACDRDIKAEILEIALEFVQEAKTRVIYEMNTLDCADDARFLQKAYGRREMAEEIYLELKDYFLSLEDPNVFKPKNARELF